MPFTETERMLLQCHAIDSSPRMYVCKWTYVRTYKHCAVSRLLAWLNALLKLLCPVVIALCDKGPLYPYSPPQVHAYQHNVISSHDVTACTPTQLLTCSYRLDRVYVWIRMSATWLDSYVRTYVCMLHFDNNTRYVHPIPSIQRTMERTDK